MIESKVYEKIDEHNFNVHVIVKGNRDEIAAELGCIFEHFYEDDALFKIFLDTMDSFIKRRSILEDLKND